MDLLTKCGGCGCIGTMHKPNCVQCMIAGRSCPSFIETGQKERILVVAISDEKIQMVAVGTWVTGLSVGLGLSYMFQRPFSLLGMMVFILGMCLTFYITAQLSRIEGKI